MSTRSGTRQQYIAHRGAKREFPENTISAFSRALALGADAIELDVHCSRDRIVVVHHDHDVRIGAGEGAETRPLASLTARELSLVDLGGEFIPTLADVLEVVGSCAQVYVELKGAGIEPEVVATLRRQRTECAIHSFDHDAVARAGALAPEIPRGLLFDRALERLETAAAAGAARDVWPRWDLIDEALLARTALLGVRVIAWTVNEPGTARTLLAAGVDGICGDDLRLFPTRSDQV
jgi:glycerophosphoryl diester phosphodiesterase